jgi:hypothetical protein
VAACFVTGIAPTEDISELEGILGEMPGVDRTKLIVITKAERSYEHDSSFLNFIHAGLPEIESDTVGTIDGDAIMTGSGGTGVPGLNTSISQMRYLSHPHVVQHVGNLPIPADEADNYNDAIEDGRVVVAYPCDDAEIAPLEAAFRGAEIRKVKTFQA